MAFIAMVFASIFLIVVVIGLGILLIGVILDIIWGVRKHKEKKIPVALKVFALLLTIWGVVQGIGPLAFVGCMSLKAKLDYKGEISDLPEESIIQIQNEDTFLTDGFDLNGVHYVGSIDSEKQVLHPQSSHKNFKCSKIGAAVYSNGKHMLIEKIENDLDANIVQLGTIYDPYMEESQIDTINDYYLNRAPLYCEVSHSSENSGMKTIEVIDSDKVRAIRDYVSANGTPYKPFDADESNDGYMIFYSFDDLFCFDFSFKETDKGMCIEYLGDYAYISEEDAKYIRSLIRD